MQLKRARRSHEADDDHTKSTMKTTDAFVLAVNLPLTGFSLVRASPAPVSPARILPARNSFDILHGQRHSSRFRSHPCFKSDPKTFMLISFLYAGRVLRNQLVHSACSGSRRRYGRDCTVYSPPAGAQTHRTEHYAGVLIRSMKALFTWRVPYERAIEGRDMMSNRTQFQGVMGNSFD